MYLSLDTRVLSMNTILIVGLGAVGTHLMELLALTPRAPRIIGADVDKEGGVSKTNNVVVGAAIQGLHPDIDFVELDVNDVDKTAEILGNINPDIVFYAVATYPYWILGSLPKEIREALEQAGFGSWLPLHLAPAYNFMRSVKKSKIKAHVVSTPYPDVVNPVLHKVHLAPTVGIGNIDILATRVSKTVAEKLGVPMSNVSVFMIAHHFHAGALSPGGSSKIAGAPFFLKILVGERDVTKTFSPYELLSWTGAMALPAGRDRVIVQTSSSALKILLAILDDTKLLTHAPGPEGLPGGYPVRLSARGAEVVLPEELSKSEAVKINENAQRFDGIERIKEDGTVVFTKKSNEIMVRLLGYDCQEIHIQECQDRSRELSALFEAFLRKHAPQIYGM